MERFCEVCKKLCHCVREDILTKCESCMCKEKDDIGSFSHDLQHHETILNGVKT
jgi:hypothetical protein